MVLQIFQVYIISAIWEVCLYCKRKKGFVFASSSFLQWEMKALNLFLLGLCLRKKSEEKMMYSAISIYALSFYRSQNVLDQKFIYILCQSQTFFARQKDDLHSVKLVFVTAQKFLKRQNAVKFLGWLIKFGPRHKTFCDLWKDKA